MKQKTILGALLAVALMASCTSQPQDKAQPRSVKIYEVAGASQSATTSMPGKVKASGEANLSFRIAGPISHIYARPGKLVRRGEVLATLDARDYTTQLAATEAEYASVKAQAERIIRLHQEQSVSDNDYDKAVGSLKQITQKLQAHRNALADTRLVAPYDGYIQEPLRREGETVGAGMPVLTIYSAGMPEVEINISAVEYMRRAQFSSFTCTLESFPGREFPLELVSIDPIANLNQLYTVRLKFVAGGDRQELPSVGMSTMVRIAYSAEEDSAATLPMSAVWEREGKSYVWGVEGADDSLVVRALPIRLQEILRSGSAVCTGLQPGTRIVSAGVSALREGQYVRPIAEVSPTNVGGLL